MGHTKELIRMAEKLNKMVSKSKMDGALDLLKKLNSFTMTVQLLQSTRIGVAVNAIRKHCLEEEVVTLAKILIKNWKKLLESSKRQKQHNVEKESHAPGWKGSTSHQRKSSKSPDGEQKHRQESQDVLKQQLLCYVKIGSTSNMILCLTIFDMFRSNSKPRQDGPKTPTCPISPVFPSSACAPSDSPRIYQEMKSTDIKYRNRVRSRISNLKDPKIQTCVAMCCVEL
ncbi:hypothetical protein JRQ81_011784 [Phrynocephalus forsythii]|uniref:TFIIS N-terminal domain-containing protein n=1 Tax=Phrynocephalus forsythii TaxID=171643 RepID=A0A9Q0X6H4_9SAUR|nr:hypothetical protein JRQ81_011784 [Phrynocephalus forsythii]